MSANFHAFQNRGFLFTGYEVIAAQWRERFAGFDPFRIAGILGLSYDEQYLELTYYGSHYRLRLSDGVLEKECETKEDPWAGHARVGTLCTPEMPASSWTEELYFNEAMAIYHVLTYTKDSPCLTGIFIPAQQAEKGRTGGPDPLLDSFARTFAGRTEDLSRAAKRIGGKEISGGDAAFSFRAMEDIELRLLFWDADEDFPAQVQILVEEHITDYMHPETIGCFISDLFEKLTREA